MRNRIKTSILKLFEEQNNIKDQGLINNIIKNNDIFKNKNIIEGILDIKLNQIEDNIILFNTDIKEGIDVYLNNKKVKP